MTFLELLTELNLIFVVIINSLHLINFYLTYFINMKVKNKYWIDINKNKNKFKYIK